MSERMTSVRLPSHSMGQGYADWGRKTAPEMIAIIRRQARYQLDWARDVLTARDEDFQVETYVGVHVQRNREIIQEGRKK